MNIWFSTPVLQQQLQKSLALQSPQTTAEQQLDLADALQGALMQRLLAWAPHLVAFSTSAAPYFELLQSLLAEAAAPAAVPTSLTRQPSRCT